MHRTAKLGRRDCGFEMRAIGAFAHDRGADAAVAAGEEADRLDQHDDPFEMAQLPNEHDVARLRIDYDGLEVRAAPAVVPQPRERAGTDGLGAGTGAPRPARA